MEFMNFQIRDCNDVMACQGITDLVNQVAMNQGEITVNAGRIDTNEMMVTQHTTDILNINNELSMIQIRTC